jgi:threonine aldolase
LTDDLWLDNAHHAKDMAARLAAATRDIPGVELVGDVQANSVFARLPQSAIRPLQDWSFFWVWDEEAVVRWMTSFATAEEDVTRFAHGVRQAS